MMKQILHPAIKANRRRAQRLAPYAYALLEQVSGRIVSAEMAVSVDFAVQQVERALRYDHS